MVGCTTADSACDVPSQVFFIDFGQSKLDPTPAECEEELLQLRSVMSGSPGSGGCWPAGNCAGLLRSGMRWPGTAAAVCCHSVVLLPPPLPLPQFPSSSTSLA